MVDYIDPVSKWEYDFTKMTVYSDLKERPASFPLEVRDGLLGWIDEFSVWRLEVTQVKEAYSKWLDKQIYGESNG